MTLTEACLSALEGNFISHKSFDAEQSMHGYNSNLYYEDGPNLSINGGIEFLQREEWAQENWYVKYPAENVDTEKLKELHKEYKGRMLDGKSYEACIIK